MGGRAPGGNSTSTTGPMTWVSLPFSCWVWAMSSILPILGGGRAPPYLSGCACGGRAPALPGLTGGDEPRHPSFQGLGPTHDLHQLLGDVGLAGAVVLEGELADELLGVAAGRVHGGHARAVLAGGRVEQGPPHLDAQVARHQVAQELVASRLVDEVHPGPGVAGS